MRWIPRHPFKGDDPGAYAITWILAALFLAWPYFAAGAHGEGAFWAEAGWVVFLLACWKVIIPFIRGLRGRPPAGPRAGRRNLHPEHPRPRAPAADGTLSMDELATRVVASATDPDIAQTRYTVQPPSPIGEADVDVATGWVTRNVPGATPIDVEYVGEVDGALTYRVIYELDEDPGPDGRIVIDGPGDPEPAPSRLDAAKIARLRARRAARTPPPRT